MHVIFRPPIPHAKFDEVNQHFNEWYPPREHRGIVHTMFCGAEGDPGWSVAGIMGASGKFHLGPPVHDVMSHEFCHELGLIHDAFQPHNCPIYNSIMSYTYIVGAGHRLDLAVYSEGALSSLVLNERHLSERLPFPLRKVQFLAMTPYQYRLEPSPDGHSTLIDWNWNGILGEENVVADINYDHGTDIGRQYDVGRADGRRSWSRTARPGTVGFCSSCRATAPCTFASGSVPTSTRTAIAGRPRRWSSLQASPAT